MANTNVKGITVEFSGDTTKLDKALRQVRQSTKGVDAELKKVNNALKFNPKNVDLLKQKQDLLKQKIEKTTTSLKDLKDMQNQLDADKVDKNSEEYRELQREIIATESKLKHFQTELAKVNAKTTSLYKLGDAFEAAGKKIEGAGRSLAPVSRAAGAITGALGAVTYKAGQTADELNTLSKQTGISTHDLQLYAAASDLTDVSVEALAKTHQKLKKNMLGAQDGTNEQAQYFEQLGINITNADGSLRDANDVFDETIAALGKMENETERDAIAMAIFGKSANELNPIIEDGGATYEKVAKIMAEHGLEPVSQEELDKANEFNDQIDTIKLVFSQAVQIIGTKIAGTLLPLMKKVTNAASKFAGVIAKLNGAKLAKFGGFTAALTALSPVLIGIGKLMQMFGGKMKAVAETVAKVAVKFPKLGRALGLLTNPIGLIVAALAGLGLAIGKSGKSADELVKAFDEMVKKASKKIGELIPKVVEILKSIGAAIVKNAPIVIQGLMTLLEAIVKEIPVYAPKLLQAAINLIGKIVEAVPVVLPKLLKAVGDMIGALVKALPGLSKALKDAAVAIAKTVWENIKKVFAKVKEWFKGKFSAAISGIKQGFTGVYDFFKARWDTIKGVFGKVKEWFKGKFEGAISGIKAGFTGIYDFFHGKWESIKNVFAGKNGTKVKDWFKNKFSGAWSAIKGVFSGWGEWWGGLWTKIKNKFKDIGTNISTAISNGVKTGINNLMSSLESKLNHVVVTVNKIIKFINDHSPLNIGYLGAVTLPRLAKGGVLTGAQMVIAGEAGPEAIIPLDKLFAQMDKMTNKIAGTGGGITVNVYGAEGQSVRSLAEEVRKVLIETEKRRTLAWQ